MMLNLPTLWTVFVVNFLALGLIWAYVMRCYPKLEAARFWTASAFTAAAGAVIAMPRFFVESALPLLAGGTAMILAACLAGMGINCFYDRPISWRNAALIIGVSMGATVFFAFVYDSMPLRMLSYSVGQALPLALALVLLIGAGLMVRAFWRLLAVDVGVRPEGVLTMRLALPSAAYSKEQVLAFWPRLEGQLASLPGVAAATVASGLPPTRELNANDTEIEGFVPRPGGPVQNVDYYQICGPRFFRALGIRLMEGRFLDERDVSEEASAVVVNYTMAQTFWPGQSAVGRRVRVSGDTVWRTVVGVVGDVKNAGVDRPAGTELFFPSAVFPVRTAWVVVRTAGDPARLANAVRSEIRNLDPTLPVAQVRTMEEVISTATARPRLLTLLLTLFSAVALALAAVGIYGVISYAVAQRTAEFGIRMAIGAQPGNVLGLVLRQGLLLGASGIAGGAAGAVLLTRFMKRILFGVDSLDPLTFAVMAGVLGGVAMLACLMPALRAARVDPLVALRYE